MLNNKVKVIKEKRVGQGGGKNSTVNVNDNHYTSIFV